jgi:hypothetical protein
VTGEGERHDRPRRARGYEGRTLRTAREAISPREGRWVWGRRGRPLRRLCGVKLHGVWSGRHANVYAIAVSGAWTHVFRVDLTD